MDSFKPDYWQAFADGIGDDGSKEEVGGKQVDEAEHQHLQQRSHVSIQMNHGWLTSNIVRENSCP